jgi:hypothetical protein
MSRENVEKLRRIYAVPYGGEEWLALVDEWVDADCELEDRTLPEVAVGLKGPAALRAEAARMMEAFEDVSYEVEDVLDLDERAAVRLRGSGRGRSSGRPQPGRRPTGGGTVGQLRTRKDSVMSAEPVPRDMSHRRSARSAWTTHAIAVGAALVAMLSAVPAAFAGRAVITGHDADLHCDGGGPQCSFVKTAIAYVRAGAPDPSKPVLVLDNKNLHLQKALAQAELAPAPPSVVMDPSSAQFASEPLTTAKYSAILVASDATCGGCDLNSFTSTSDSDAINTRRAELAAFFNAGGGLLFLAGADHGGGSSGAPNNAYYAPLPLPASGVPVSPPFTLTAKGMAIGFTDNPSPSLSSINCCKTHNSFSQPPAGSALVAAETDSKGLVETLVAEGQITSGGFTPPPDTGGGGGSTPPATTPPPAFGPGGAFGIPSNRTCVSRRAFPIHVRRRRGITYQTVLVALNGKRVATVRGPRTSATIDLRGLPKGTFKVRITAVTTNALVITGTRSYHTCAKKRPPHRGPKLEAIFPAVHAP